MYCTAVLILSVNGALMMMMIVIVIVDTWKYVMVDNADAGRITSSGLPTGMPIEYVE